MYTIYSEYHPFATAESLLLRVTEADSPDLGGELTLLSLFGSLVL